MKIILLKDVAKLGKKNDVKEVSSGHALNLLIPRGDAIAATKQSMKQVEIQKTKSEGERAIQNELIAENLAALNKTVLTVKGKANDKGHLFAGLHREEIAAELFKQTRLQISPESIQLEHPIKEVGEHSINVESAGKSARFKLVIEAAK
jgi:large subunit ribosomal protein L9